jgi:hypothetical protein
MHTTDPDYEEVAAALAAVRCYLAAQEEAAVAPAPPSTWRGAARLLAHDVAPARLPAPNWGNVERLKRLAGKG